LRTLTIGAAVVALLHRAALRCRVDAGLAALLADDLDVRARLGRRGINDLRLVAQMSGEFIEDDLGPGQVLLADPDLGLDLRRQAEERRAFLHGPLGDEDRDTGVLEGRAGELGLGDAGGLVDGDGISKVHGCSPPKDKESSRPAR